MLVVAAAILISLLLVAGCGSQAGQESSPTTPAASATTSPGPSIPPSGSFFVVHVPSRHPSCRLSSFIDISFANAHDGWATGWSDQYGSRWVLAATSDRGLTWHLIASKQAVNGTGIGVHLISPSTGIWVAGVPFETSNGGQSFTYTPVKGAEWAGWGEMSFASDRVGWLGGLSGSIGSGRVIAKTTDGGLTWQTQMADAAAPRVAVGVLDAASVSDAYAISNGLWATHDGGTTSRPVRSNIDTRRISALSFTTGLVGWATENGSIFKTTDGGRHWEREYKGTDAFRVDFVDEQDGWAVGANGLVLHTSDGGRSWSKVDAGTQLDLSSVDFIDRAHGWIAGENGACLRTTDGGRSWNGNTGNAVTAATKRFGQQVQQVLQQSAVGRREAAAAVSGTDHFSLSPAKALDLIDQAIANRQKLFSRMQWLESSVTSDARANDLWNQLIFALQQSLADDQHYRSWIMAAASAYAAGAHTAPTTTDYREAAADAGQVDTAKAAVATFMRGCQPNVAFPITGTQATSETHPAKAKIDKPVGHADAAATQSGIDSVASRSAASDHGEPTMNTYLMERIQRIYAAIGVAITTDSSEFTPVTRRVGDHYETSVKFDESASDAQMQNAVYSAVDNVANFGNHLKKWAKTQSEGHCLGGSGCEGQLRTQSDCRPLQSQ